MKFLSVGDNCIDNYVELARRFPGGNALNVAIYANRLPNVTATYIGVVGTDENGDFLLSEIRREGFKTDNVIRLPGKTAITTINVRNGERIFTNYDEGVQKNAIFPFEFLEKFYDYDIAHFTVWGFGREHIKFLKKSSKIKISLDFSNQLDHESINILPYLDYAFFSGKELLKKEEDVEKRIKDLKKRTSGLIIFTFGEYGSIAFDGKTFFRGQAKQVNVVDTLGAGDSFIASFLCSLQMDGNITKALEKGHETAKEICLRLGAWGGDDN
jgi:fructoselysine 6-kinase